LPRPGRPKGRPYIVTGAFHMSRLPQGRGIVKRQYVHRYSLGLAGQVHRGIRQLGGSPTLTEAKGPLTRLATLATLSPWERAAMRCVFSTTLSLGERVARCPDALHREAGRVRGYLGGSPAGGHEKPRTYKTGPRLLRHEDLEPEEARWEIELHAQQSRERRPGQAPGRPAVVWNDASILGMDKML